MAGSDLPVSLQQARARALSGVSAQLSPGLAGVWGSSPSDTVTPLQDAPLAPYQRADADAAIASRRRQALTDPVYAAQHPQDTLSALQGVAQSVAQAPARMALNNQEDQRTYIDQLRQPQHQQEYALGYMPDRVAQGLSQIPMFALPELASGESMLAREAAPLARPLPQSMSPEALSALPEPGPENTEAYWTNHGGDVLPPPNADGSYDMSKLPGWVDYNWDKPTTAYGDMEGNPFGDWIGMNNSYGENFAGWDEGGIDDPRGPQSRNRMLPQLLNRQRVIDDTQLNPGSRLYDMLGGQRPPATFDWDGQTMPWPTIEDNIRIGTDPELSSAFVGINDKALGDFRVGGSREGHPLLGTNDPAADPMMNLGGLPPSRGFTPSTGMEGQFPVDPAQQRSAWWEGQFGQAPQQSPRARAFPDLPPPIDRTGILDRLRGDRLYQTPNTSVSIGKVPGSPWHEVEWNLRGDAPESLVGRANLEQEGIQGAISAMRSDAASRGGRNTYILRGMNPALERRYGRLADQYASDAGFSVRRTNSGGLLFEPSAARQQAPVSSVGSDAPDTGDLPPGIFSPADPAGVPGGWTWRDLMGADAPMRAPGVAGMEGLDTLAQTAGQHGRALDWLDPMSQPAPPILPQLHDWSAPEAPTDVRDRPLWAGAQHVPLWRDAARYGSDARRAGLDPVQTLQGAAGLSLGVGGLMALVAKNDPTISTPFVPYSERERRQEAYRRALNDQDERELRRRSQGDGRTNPFNM